MLTHLSSAKAQQWIPMKARVLLALLFVVAGFMKIIGFAGTAAYIGSTGLPMPEALTVLAIITEFGGGLMLLFGFYGRYAAVALFLFTLLATVIFHNNLADQLQLTMALKNIAIMGGLALVAVHGTGAWSLKKESVPVSGYAG